MMDTRPDIEVRSPDRGLQLVVEVKSTPGASREWAAKLRRNLLAHGAVPNAPYFLIAVPQRLFLWRRASSSDAPPDFDARTADVLDDYLGRWSQPTNFLSEESLQLALSSWLRDLTKAMRTPRPDSEADRMLLESGAYGAIRDGSVVSEANR